MRVAILAQRIKVPTGFGRRRSMANLKASPNTTFGFGDGSGLCVYDGGLSRGQDLQPTPDTRTTITGLKFCRSPSKDSQSYRSKESNTNNKQHTIRLLKLRVMRSPEYPIDNRIGCGVYCCPFLDGLLQVQGDMHFALVFKPLNPKNPQP